MRANWHDLARAASDAAPGLAALVEDKQRQYGDSAGKTGAILAILYPHGVPAHAYDDALLIVRTLDKLSRIAQRGADGLDLGGESPWRDVAGYGLLGAAKDAVRVAVPAGEVCEDERDAAAAAMDRVLGTVAAHEGSKA